MKGKKKNASSTTNLQTKPSALSAQAHAHLLSFTQHAGQTKVDAEPIPTAQYLAKTPPKLTNQLQYNTEKVQSRVLQAAASS